MEKSTHLKYKDAIKLPKGGAVKMDKDNFTAQASEMISAKQGTRPEAIYNWANKHNVDLVKYGYVLADIKSNDELLEDVLEDKFDAVKTLIDKVESERKNKIKELKDMGISNAEEIYEESLAKSEKEKITPTLRKKLNKYINEAINIKDSNIKETGIYDGDFVDELKKKFGEYPEGLSVDIDGDGMYYLKFNGNTGNFEVSATVYNNTKKINTSDINENSSDLEIYDFINRLDSKEESSFRGNDFIVGKKNGKTYDFQKNPSEGKWFLTRVIDKDGKVIYDKVRSYLDKKKNNVTRKEKRNEISNDYGLTNKEVNEFMRLASSIKFTNKPVESYFEKGISEVLVEKGLLKKDKYKFDLTNEGAKLAEEYFNINDSEIEEKDSKLEKLKEEYPIVLEWSEGLKETNIGFNYLYELANLIKQAGMTKTPDKTVIKNKVWFKDYPHYVNIENGTDEKDGNYNTDLHGYESLNYWLKKYDPKFDWSIYDYGNNYKFAKEYTPKAQFESGDLVKFHTSNFDDENVDIDTIDVSFDNHYGYVVKSNKYVRDSKRWKPHWTYTVKDKFDDSIIYDNVMESRMTKVTEEKINKEIVSNQLDEGNAPLLTKEEADELSKEYVEKIKGEYSNKGTVLHQWFEEVICRYPKMIVEWQNLQLEYMPKKEQELLEYLCNDELPNTKQFFNSLMRYNVGKSDLIGIYELISEKLFEHNLPKKVDFKLSPNDKGLDSIFKEIVSDDDLREKLTGINFDESGVVGTDAHKMVFISGNTDKKGVFHIGKKLGTEIKDSYPNYKAVIPKEVIEGSIVTLDRKQVESMYLSLKTIKNAKYYFVTNNAFTFSLYKGEGSWYNIKLIIELLESWLKIGFDKLEFSNKTQVGTKLNRTILMVSPNIKKFTNFKGNGSIIMGIMHSNEMPYFTIPQTQMYIDLNTARPETAGITDDLYAEFNNAYGTIGAIEEKNQIEELESLIELLKEVLAENPKDEESKDAIELYEETLAELKKNNAEKFAKGGRVGCGCQHSFAKGGKLEDKYGYLNKYTTGSYLTMYKTDLPDGTLVGFDSDFGKVYAYKGDVVDIDKLPKGVEVKKFEKGGVVDSNGSKYFLKTFESKGNTWSVLFVWGKSNYVSVRKESNNPFMNGSGKQFTNVDEAIAYYKNPDMKVQLIFAENEAKELGYVPKFENGGEIGEKKLYYATYDDNNLGILLLDENGNKKFEILHASVLRGSNYNPLTGSRIDISDYNYGKIKKASEKDFDIYRVYLPSDFHELNNPSKLKEMIKKGDIVTFKCEGSETSCRGEVLDVLSKDEYLISKGIKSVIIPKDKVIGIAPAKINTIFERDFSIYDERVMAINSTYFYTTYGVGENPFEVNYDESNEYGYGIYFLDEKYSGIGKYNESRILAIKPNVKKPLIFLNDDGSSFNSQYKEAYEKAIKYDGVKNKDDFNKKMVELGYDSMLVSDIHGTHLIFFYNDPKLYSVKSDVGN